MSDSKSSSSSSSASGSETEKTLVERVKALGRDELVDLVCTLIGNSGDVAHDIDEHLMRMEQQQSQRARRRGDAAAPVLDLSGIESADRVPQAVRASKRVLGKVEKQKRKHQHAMDAQTRLPLYCTVLKALQSRLAALLDASEAALHLSDDDEAFVSDFAMSIGAAFEELGDAALADDVVAHFDLALWTRLGVDEDLVDEWAMAASPP